MYFKRQTLHNYVGFKGTPSCTSEQRLRDIACYGLRLNSRQHPLKGRFFLQVAYGYGKSKLGIFKHKGSEVSPQNVLKWHHEAQQAALTAVSLPTTSSF